MLDGWSEDGFDLNYHLATGMSDGEVLVHEAETGRRH
jgi:hypothetical protein